MSNDERLRCTPSDIEVALDEAIQLVSRRGGGAMTPHRIRALRLLLTSATPLRPYHLMKHLKEDSSTKPPTMYRTLDALIEMGLIHRIESLGAYTPCRHWSHAHSPCFLICSSCGRVDEMNVDQVVESLMGESAAVRFRTRSAAVEVNGICQDCM